MLKKHLKKTLEYNAGGLIITVGEKFYLAEDESNLDGGDDVAVEIYDPLVTLLAGADFVGASDGLICVSNNKINKLFISNSTPELSRMLHSALVEFPRCGFGYDHVYDDYQDWLVLSTITWHNGHCL